MNMIIGYRNGFVYWLLGNDIYRADYYDDSACRWYCTSNSISAEIAANGPLFDAMGEPINI
jgi:hypothetical protein